MLFRSAALKRRLSMGESSAKNMAENVAQTKAELDQYTKAYERYKNNKAEIQKMADQLDQEKADASPRRRSLRRNGSVNGESAPMPASAPDHESYPWGTYVEVKLIEANDGPMALVGLNYSISRVIGWAKGDGNNNSNSLSTIPMLEVVERLGKEALMPLDTEYCFQFTRPSDAGKSLQSAMNATNIFSKSNSGAIKELPKEDAANSLDADDTFENIRKKYKGREGEVVRVIIEVRKRK